MQALPRQEDLADLGISCCIDNLYSDIILESPRLRLLDYKQSPTPTPEKNETTTKRNNNVMTSPPKSEQTNGQQRRRLSSRMSNSLRRSSKDLMSSFTKSLTSHTDKTSPCPSAGVENVTQVSTSDAAKLVAAEYFAGQEGYEIRGEADDEDVGNKEFDELTLSMPSLFDGKDDDDCNYSPCSIEGDQTRRTSTTCSTTNNGSESDRISPPPSEEEVLLSLEVGQSAQEYLEECFYTEVSVLDRQKFNAIPETVKSDFTIRRHLGKGCYSDVFEVVCKDNDILLRAKNKKMNNVGTTSPGSNRRSSTPRGRRASLSSSITVATLSRPPARVSDKCIVLAMKCLRPQIRSDIDQFTIGAEDLVHETAILANLSHPNIIKLHGRSSGNLTDSFKTNDGYFILLDKLDETLLDRIVTWKKDPKCITIKGPNLEQIEVAQTIAKALGYLHSKKIIFRDLKPDNVGFDSQGVVKLFDFGFAIGLPERKCHSRNGMVSPSKIFDRCGTPRYMAPENGLQTGYGIPTDVYSFGIMLWEMCSLEKPFASFKCAEEFERSVFVDGTRPLIPNQWPATIKDLMTKCWSGNPSKRPTMLDVERILSLYMSQYKNEDGLNDAEPVKTIRRPKNRRSSMSSSFVGW